MQQGTYLEANNHSVNQEIPNFYGIQQFIIMFTRAHNSEALHDSL
jgi:hypothetical protein